MTEKMFQEAKKDFENKLKKDFNYLNRSNREVLSTSITDLLVVAFEDAVRDNVPVVNLPPANFPAALVHDADYYGLDNEELSKAVLKDDTLGCSMIFVEGGK